MNKLEHAGNGLVADGSASDLVALRAQDLLVDSRTSARKVGA